MKAQQLNLKYLDNKKIRLDKYLAAELNLTRTVIQKLILNKKILINDKVVKNNYLLKFNDAILIFDSDLDCQRHQDIKEENIDLDILYEDSEIIVINKPKNMVCHISLGHSQGTLVNGLKYHFKNNLANSSDNLRPGIVHRLDKDTTGILVIAKNDHSLINLQKQFKKHTIIRKYYALVHKQFPYSELKVDLPIARDKLNRKKNAVIENGREAITIIKLIKQFLDYSLIECELKTGRTHQIRVHLSYLKYPLVGDNLYGYKKDSTKFPQGQFLCAYYLQFIHPVTNKIMEFEISLPKYFQDFIAKL